MVDLRRSPETCVALVVPPDPFESFASWIDRFSAELEVPPGLLLRHLQLHLVDPVGGAYSAYGVSLTGDEYSTIEQLTGLEPGMVRRTLLDRYEGALYQASRTATADGRPIVHSLQHQWVLPRTSRACRVCLEQRPMWRLVWKLGFAAACTEHQVMLTDTCSLCGTGHRLRGGNREPISKRHIASPTECRGIAGGRPCGHDLRDGNDIASPADVVAAQVRLTRVADTGSGHIAGETVAARDWFETFVALTSAARFGLDPSTVEVDDLGRGARDEITAYCQRRDTARSNRAGQHNPQYRQCPESSVWAATLSRIVLPIMDAPDEHTAFERLDTLHTQVQTRRAVLGRTVIGPDIGLAGPLRNRWAELETGVRTFTAAGRASRSLRTVATALQNSETGGQIPQLIDATRYNSLIAPFLPGTAPLTGRCFAALAVARHRGAKTWPDAGTQIGMTRRKAALRADVVSRRVVDIHRFWNAVGDLSDELAALPDVDYRARRLRLAGLTALPRDRYATIARNHGVSPSDRFNRSAAAWVWGELVGGDWRDSPAVQLWPTSATNESRREKVRQFLKQAPAAMLDELLALGHEVLEET
jgi:hypothetical protein